MKTRGNMVTERAGVNHVRSVVEDAGCFFKEINLQHDVGHDATIVLVVNGHVRPREVAMQIKAGVSYVSPEMCHIPASAAHIYYWAHHDLITLGIVYDPRERDAYWVDLQTESRNHWRTAPKTGKTIRFRKAAWNRFNASQFSTVLIPTLLGEAPTVSLSTVCQWVNDSDPFTHDLGVRTLRGRQYREPVTWSSLIDAFLTRPASQLTVEVLISIAMLLGHDDLGFYTGQIPKSVRDKAITTVLAFEAPEIAKALALLPEDDFDRPSVGYSLMPLWAMKAGSVAILEAIRSTVDYGAEVQGRADLLLQYHALDPDWWDLWRRD